jgi:hypothetical protein
MRKFEKMSKRRREKQNLFSGLSHQLVRDEEQNILFYRHWCAHALVLIGKSRKRNK